MGFNPALRYGSVPTHVQAALAAALSKFQSRSAVWVGTDVAGCTKGAAFASFNPALRYGSVPTHGGQLVGSGLQVSIPLCGMGRYRQDDIPFLQSEDPVSIPLCGMGRYRLEGEPGYQFQLQRFNPALRYGSVPTVLRDGELVKASRFNPALRYGSVPTWDGWTNGDEVSRFNPALRYGSVPTGAGLRAEAGPRRVSIPLCGMGRYRREGRGRRRGADPGFNPALRYGSVPTNAASIGIAAVIGFQSRSAVWVGTDSGRFLTIDPTWVEFQSRSAVWVGTDAAGVEAHEAAEKVSIPLCGMGRYRP